MKKILKKNQIIVTSLAIMIAVAGFLNYTGTKITVQDLARITGNEETKEEYHVDDNGEIVQTSASGSAMTDTASVEGTEYDSYEDYLASEDYADYEDMDYAAVSSEDGYEDVASVSSEDGYEDVSTESIEAESDESLSESADGGEISEVPGEAVLTNTSAVDFAAEAKLNREQIRSKNKELLNEVINNENISEEGKQEAVETMVSLTDISEKENAAEMMLAAKGFENAVVSISEDNVDVVICKSTLDESEVARIEDVVKRKTGVAAENIVITPVTE